MIDFSKNTYFVKRTEKDEVIKILKRHPEYRGFQGEYEFHHNGHHKDNYNYLWKHIDDLFCCYTSEETIYCDNEYITQSQIQQHSWMIGLAEVYPNEDCVQHDPQPLLPILKKIDQQLIRIE
jgi:hypothetical protein